MKLALQMAGWCNILLSSFSLLVKIENCDAILFTLMIDIMEDSCLAHIF